MATINILPNGTTSGNPSVVGNPNPAKRSESGGWNDQVSRRLTRWFYSIPVESLSGHGIAFTLTVRDCPETAKDWAVLRGIFLKRLRYHGCTRAQWLTEWQERGVPHLHGVVYFPEPYPVEKIINHWLTIASKEHGSGIKGQNAKPITDVTGWLQYLAKHSTRSVVHYQRSSENIPEGWKKTGRMWGYTGDWEIREPMKFLICQNGHVAYRRISRKLKSASVRDRFHKAKQRMTIHAENNPRILPSNLQKTFDKGCLTESDERAWLKLKALQRAYHASRRELGRSRRNNELSNKETSHFYGSSNWLDQNQTIKIITYLRSREFRVNQTG